MTEDTHKSRLLHELGEYLAEHGFARGKWFKYDRTKDSLTQFFQLTFLHTEGMVGATYGIEYAPAAGILKPLLLTMTESPENYSLPTLKGIGSEQLLLPESQRSFGLSNLQSYFPLTEQSYTSTMERLQRIFHGLAMPFFERCPDLSALDREMNDTYQDPEPGELEYYANALAVARLNGRTDFERLAAEYSCKFTHNQRFARQLESVIRALSGL